MSSVNKVILVGHLGRDPELRSFPSGDQVANVTIATSEKWRDKTSGEMRELTEWNRVVFNGKLAEFAGQYLRKGSLVYVEGSLRTRKWTGQDGVEKYATEIRADQLQMLGGRPAGDGANPSPAPAPSARRPAAAPARAPAPAAASSGFDDMDDDIPFITSAFSCDLVPSKSKRMRRASFGRAAR